jgi:hypothetical protein
MSEKGYDALTSEILDNKSRDGAVSISRDEAQEKPKRIRVATHGRRPESPLHREVILEE